jgi:uncharacterized membrane protein YgdD (TMEM256/DUF423 family)
MSGVNASMTLRVSAVFGFLAVALGAFGAHWLKPTLEANAQVATWQTAAHYHLVHAVGLVALALHGKGRVWAWRLWLWGTVIFSGALYILAVTNVKWLGAITPIGGVLLLAGWVALGVERERVRE